MACQGHEFQTQRHLVKGLPGHEQSLEYDISDVLPMSSYRCYLCLRSVQRERFPRIFCLSPTILLFRRCLIQQAIGDVGLDFGWVTFVRLAIAAATSAFDDEEVAGFDLAVGEF